VRVPGGSDAKGIAAVAVVLVVLWIFGGSYFVYLANLTAIYAIAALGLNMLTGACGLVSLGHNAFFAIGAYTSAILAAKLGVSFVVALIAAALLGTLVSLLIGVPSLRLTGIYLAMATLAVGFVVEEVILQSAWLTNGANGMSVPRPELFGWRVGGDRQFMLLIWPLTAACFWLGRNLLSGRTGRAWRAIRDNELAADALGVSLRRYKLLAFSASGFLAGLAGSLFGHYVGFIAPENFTWFLAVQFLTMIVIGGIGSLWGSLVGPAAFVALPELLRGAQDYQLGVFGLLIIVIMIVVPRGLVGLGPAIQERWWRRRPVGLGQEEA
jgi:branched-chain amino acid transport system permease protein